MGRISLGPLPRSGERDDKAARPISLARTPPPPPARKPSKISPATAQKPSQKKKNQTRPFARGEEEENAKPRGKNPTETPSPPPSRPRARLASPNHGVIKARGSNPLPLPFSSTPNHFLPIAAAAAAESSRVKPSTRLGDGFRRGTVSDAGGGGVRPGERVAGRGYRRAGAGDRPPGRRPQAHRHPLHVSVSCVRFLFDERSCDSAPRKNSPRSGWVLVLPQRRVPHDLSVALQFLGERWQGQDKDDASHPARSGGALRQHPESRRHPRPRLHLQHHRRKAGKVQIRALHLSDSSDHSRFFVF